MLDYKKLIIPSIIIVLLLSILYYVLQLKSQITDLKLENSSLISENVAKELAIQECTSSTYKLKDSIALQNETITKARADRESLVKELIQIGEENDKANKELRITLDSIIISSDATCEEAMEWLKKSAQQY